MIAGQSGPVRSPQAFEPRRHHGHLRPVADDHSAERREWARRVAVELSRLPDQQVLIVRLVYTHQLHIAVAAGWMRLTAAEASKLLAEAMRSLGSALGAEGF